MEHEGEDQVRKDISEVGCIKEGVSISWGQILNASVLDHDNKGANDEE